MNDPKSQKFLKNFLSVSLSLLAAAAARVVEVERSFFLAGLPEWPIAAAEAKILCRFSTPHRYDQIGA